MMNYGWCTYIFSCSYGVYNIKERVSWLTGKALRSCEEEGCTEIRGFCSFMNHPFIFLSLSLICFPLICCVFCSSLCSRLNVFLAHLSKTSRRRDTSSPPSLRPFPNQLFFTFLWSTCFLILFPSHHVSWSFPLMKSKQNQQTPSHPWVLLQLLGDSSDLLHSVLVSSEVALKSLVLPHQGSDLHQRGRLVVFHGQKFLLTWNTDVWWTYLKMLLQKNEE